jgi:brefeldin A-inhibited guanine nucleotide-exchange protein
MSAIEGDVEVENGQLEEISLSENDKHIPYHQSQEDIQTGQTNGYEQPQNPEVLPSYSAPLTSPTMPVYPGTSSASKPSSSHRTSITNSTSTLSTSTSASNSRPLPPLLLITPTLKAISASREAKRLPALRDAVANALQLVESGTTADKPREIFEPLRLACETGNEKLMVTSLDCISKLVSYAFFVEDLSPTAANHAHAYSSPPGSPSASNAGGLPTSLADLVTHTITSCYTESTPDAVSLQIVKALLQIVLSPHTLVHHSSLLRAVRTVYNIFLLSPSPVTQNVAQGGLTQMVHHIFGRAAEGNVEANMNGAGQSQNNINSQTPHSAAQSTFSLTTPTTADHLPHTPFSVNADLPNDPASLDVDAEVARAAAIPLPPPDGEDEFEDTEQRCVQPERAIYPMPPLSPQG